MTNIRYADNTIFSHQEFVKCKEICPWGQYVSWFQKLLKELSQSIKYIFTWLGRQCWTSWWRFPCFEKLINCTNKFSLSTCPSCHRGICPCTCQSTLPLAEEKKFHIIDICSVPHIPHKWQTQWTLQGSQSPLPWSSGEPERYPSWYLK